MENIINVDMPCFWINKENPRLIKYTSDDTSNWRFIHSSYYGHGQLVTPNKNEFGYKLNGNDYRGFLLIKVNKNQDL